jgi:broad specificity phosphatase PhoE
MKTIYLIRHSQKENSSYSNNESISKQRFDELKKLTDEGRKLAYKLSQSTFLANVKEVWASNYERAKETAKYISDNINVSPSFDERHYGDFSDEKLKDIFWANQFIDEDLKNINGESQKEVRKRFEDKINYILDNSLNDEIAIVSHNAAILFYLLKYCNLIKAEVPKKLTISYKDKILIKDSVMKSPSIMKLTFNKKDLIDIEYYDIDS